MQVLTRATDRPYTLSRKALISACGAGRQGFGWVGGAGWEEQPAWLQADLALGKCSKAGPGLAAVLQGRAWHNARRCLTGMPGARAPPPARWSAPPAPC